MIWKGVRLWCGESVGGGGLGGGGGEGGGGGGELRHAPNVCNAFVSFMISVQPNDFRNQKTCSRYSIVHAVGHPHSMHHCVSYM